MNPKYTLTKYACYTTNLTMSVVAALSPLLFLSFRLPFLSFRLPLD